MPPPVSYIDIVTYPFTQLVTQAMFNVANEQWFRRVVTTPEVIGIQTDSGGTFTPRDTIYGPDGTTVYRAAVTGVDGHYTSLETVQTYYIKVVRSLGGASNFDFTFTADVKSLNQAVPVTGDYVVNDDLAGLPAALLDGTTGEVKGYFSNVPSGEVGAIKPNNVSYWHDRFAEFSATHKIALLTDTLTYDTSIAAGTNNNLNFPRFAYDDLNDRMYLLDQFDSLYYIDSAGVVTDTGFQFPATSPQAIAISPDATKLYYVFGDDDTSIHVKNLATFADLADLYTVPVYSAGDILFCQAAGGWPGDMFTFPDGSVVLWYRDMSTLFYHLLHVSAAGALLDDVNFAGEIIIDHLAYIDGATDKIIIWTFTDFNSDTARFGIWDLSSGAYDSSFTVPVFSNGIAVDSTEKFGISSSCTFVRIQLDADPPGGSGTIQVIKVTTPGGITQDFEFTAGGGLSPSSFTLAGDGDSQNFLLVAAGSGYSIEETPEAGYVTTYEVSNDSPINNITVEEDEVVIVTVTNVAQVTGGIYKIVPGKRNDTLWNEDGSETIVKIPGPFGTGGYLGD